eukprot:g4498.t1
MSALVFNFPTRGSSSEEWSEFLRERHSSKSLQQLVREALHVSVDRSMDQIEHLMLWLRRFRVISYQLSPAIRSELACAVYYEKLEPNEVLFKEGERGRVYYMILSGSVVVTSGKGKFITTLGPDKSFGENTLFNPNAERSFTVRAGSEGAEFAALNSNAFLPVRLYQRSVIRKWADVLQKHFPIFDCWKSQQLVHLCQVLHVYEVPAGTEMYHEGDKSSSMFFVLSGDLKACVDACCRYRKRWPKPGTKDQFGELVEIVKKEVVTEILGVGSFFGTENLIASTDQDGFPIPPPPDAKLRVSMQRSRMRSGDEIIAKLMENENDSDSNVKLMHVDTKRSFTIVSKTACEVAELYEKDFHFLPASAVKAIRNCSKSKQEMKKIRSKARQNLSEERRISKVKVNCYEKKYHGRVFRKIDYSKGEKTPEKAKPRLTASQFLKLSEKRELLGIKENVKTRHDRRVHLGDKNKEDPDKAQVENRKKLSHHFRARRKVKKKMKTVENSKKPNFSSFPKLVSLHAERRKRMKNLMQHIDNVRREYGNTKFSTIRHDDLYWCDDRYEIRQKNFETDRGEIPIAEESFLTNPSFGKSTFLFGVDNGEYLPTENLDIDGNMNLYGNDDNEERKHSVEERHDTFIEKPYLGDNYSNLELRLCANERSKPGSHHTERLLTAKKQKFRRGGGTSGVLI